MNWPLLQNSLLVAGLTTLLSVALGSLAAMALATLPRRGRLVGVALAALALALPPFLVANCWLDLLGVTGRWRPWLPVNMYSTGGVAGVLTLMYWPVALLLVLGALSRLETAQLEVDPALAGWPLLRWLLWPQARAAVGQAAAVIFVLSLNHFTVPAILQVKVLPAEVWILFNTHLDSTEALIAGWPLMAAPLLLVLALRRTEMAWPRDHGPATARALRRQLGRGWGGVAVGVTSVLLLTSVAVPLAQLASSGRTWAEVPRVVQAAPAVIGYSFGYAAVTATLGVAMALVTWHWRVGLLLWLPLLVPGTVLGIGLIQVFNHPGLDLIYRGPAIVVLAFTLRYLALPWNAVAAARRGVDPHLTDAARLEGAAGWSLFRWVHWPQIAPTAAAAWYVTYLLCLWDVETILLICPPGGQTLAQTVFNLLHYGHAAQVNAYCVVLLGLAVAPLLVAGAGRWRGGPR